MHEQNRRGETAIGRRRVRHWALCVSAVILSAGCEKPAPLLTLDAPADAPGSSVAPGAMEVVSVTPVAWDGIRPPIGRDILRDRDLSAFAAQSAAWAVYGDASMIRVDTETESPPAAAGDGPVVVFTGTAETTLSQKTNRLPAVADTAWIRASVWARSDGPGQCYLAIGHESDGGTPVVKTMHPGDGQWRELRIDAPYMWSLQPGEVTFVVGANGPAAFASPALTLSLATPADRMAVNGHTAEWIANGSFETYGESGGYYPWRMNAWRGAAGSAGVETVAETPDGRFGAALGRPEGAMRLFQRLPDFDASYAGARYVARVWARSGAAGDCSLGLRVSDRSGAPLENLSPTANHPGDGQWRELSAEIVLPGDANAYPLSVTVDLIRRNLDPAAVYFDAASFRPAE